ncbi:MAG: MBL fold metallo-hydrolase [Promethearchaeota archaeon]
MQVTVLGSSSFFPSLRRSWTSLFLNLGGGDAVLVDAGSWRLMTFRADILHTNRVYITHNHPDHTGFIGALVRRMRRQNRTRPLTIFCPTDTVQRLHHFIRIFNHNKIPLFVQIHPFTPDIPRTIDHLSSSQTEVKAAAACHTTLTAAYAFCQGDKRIIISPDTGPRCPTLLTLARGANAWFHDCTFATGRLLSIRKGHSTPQNAGGDAARANVKALILIHISGLRLRNPRAIVAAARLHFNGEIYIAKDGMSFNF